jgi:hypothetical protein
MQRSEQFLRDQVSDDRRMFERKPADDQVLGRRIDHTISARQNPRLNLTLRDVSVGGMAAISDRPVDQGERVSVVFPARGLIRGWDAVGRVLRCEPNSRGYQLAIEFEPLPRAA